MKPYPGCWMERVVWSLTNLLVSVEEGKQTTPTRTNISYLGHTASNVASDGAFLNCCPFPLASYVLLGMPCNMPACQKGIFVHSPDSLSFLINIPVSSSVDSVFGTDFPWCPTLTTCRIQNVLLTRLYCQHPLQGAFVFGFIFLNRLQNILKHLKTKQSVGVRNSKPPTLFGNDSDHLFFERAELKPLLYINSQLFVLFQKPSTGDDRFLGGAGISSCFSDRHFFGLWPVVAISISCSCRDLVMKIKKILADRWELGNLYRLGWSRVYWTQKTSQNA